jgi:chitinase
MHRVGYVTSWSIYGEHGRDMSQYEEAIKHLTHLIYAFCKIDPVAGIISWSDPWADVDHPISHALSTTPTLPCQGNIGEILLLKKNVNPALKLGLSIGGWSARASFSTAIDSVGKRQNFVASCQRLLQFSQFDFIDLDWEYPTKACHTSHLLHLLELFKSAHIPITLAMPAALSNKTFPDYRTFLKDYVDLFLIMTYDYNGPSWSQTSGHLAPLSAVIQSIQSYITDYHYESSKLCLGIPLYGQIFYSCAGLQQPFLLACPHKKHEQEESTTTIPFCDISSASGNLYEDKDGHFMITSKGHFITFDSPDFVEKKLQLLTSLKLGGVFFWELSGDLSCKILKLLPKLHSSREVPK